jgi:hypothetical protein
MLRQGRPTGLTLAQQLYAMQSKFPQLVANYRRQRWVVWTGPWRSSELSDFYTLRVAYEQGLRPKISIVAPVLALAPGHTKLPHVYAAGQHDICVHRPEQWNRTMLIAETIMPWISQWLYFYETWVVTGKWLGKGTHPCALEHGER